MNKIHVIPRGSAGVMDEAALKQLCGLHETIAEIAGIAKTVDYRPADSFDFHRSVIAWAIEWEAAWFNGLAAGMWPDDEWIERTEDFALAKLQAVSHECLRWVERDCGTPVLPSMDSILPAGPATTDGDTFIYDKDGSPLASYGPRVLDGSGGTQCVVPAIGVAPQFWGIYSHDVEGYAYCVGDAVDRDSAARLAEIVARDVRHDRSTQLRIKGEMVDGEQLYWSNETGWCDRESATVFSAAELASMNMPIGATGKEAVSHPPATIH